MGCTTTNTEVNFKLATLKFSYAASYQFPVSFDYAGVVPLCVYPPPAIPIIHAISVNGITYIVEQNVPTIEDYTQIINSYIGNATEFAMSITDGCGTTYGGNYTVTYGAPFPIVIQSYVLNGVTINAGNIIIANQSELDNWFASLYWTVNSQNDYSIETEDQWGQISVTYGSTTFSFASELQGVVEDSTTITKVNSVESCPTSYGYFETECLWGASGASYKYFCEVSDFNRLFPQTNVEFTVDGVTTLKDFDTAEDFIDYMESLGFQYMNTVNNFFFHDDTTEGWQSIIFPSEEIVVIINQYASKLDLEQTCTQRRITTPVAPVIHTPLTVKTIGKIECALVSNGCKMQQYGRIGRNTDAMKQAQIKLLLMDAIFSLSPTETQIYDLQCYFDMHLQNY